MGDEGDAGVKEGITFLTRANGYMTCSILKKQQIGRGGKKKKSNMGNVELEKPLLVRYTNGRVEGMVGGAVCESQKEAWGGK